MYYKKLEGVPERGFVTIQLSRFIGFRRFGIDLVYGLDENRIFTARRIRIARKYLREFILDEEPKKVVDFPGKLV